MGGTVSGCWHGSGGEMGRNSAHSAAQPLLPALASPSWTEWRSEDTSTKGKGMIAVSSKDRARAGEEADGEKALKELASIALGVRFQAQPAPRAALGGASERGGALAVVQLDSGPSYRTV